MLKTLRTAIRLKYSLLADDELNEMLPKAEAAFNAAVLKGELPPPLDLKSLGV
jgi:predicted phage-related endonuclease